MSRTKLFIHNFLVYGLGSIISKIIPLIMLPVITSIMTDTKYYGINDMVNLVISFASAIAMMGMYDAMFRMFFDKEDDNYKKSICSTALFFVILSSLVICIIMFIFRKPILNLIINNVEYNLLFFIIIFNTFLTGVQGIVSAPTRMQNKRKVFLVTNTLTPVLSYAIAIPLLLKGMYVYALPLAAVSSSLTMAITFFFLNREWFSIREVSKEHLISLIKIGIPLMPTFLMYWVCNSFDRVMIKSMLGLDELGIYSVASRIAQISQFIYTAFAMGWQYFAFSTMNDKDQKKLTANIANYLMIISIVATIGVTALSKVLFFILAKGEYSNGFIILPYLFISPLFLMIFQVIGNQFIIIKKTYPIPMILTGAIVVNISCNYLLIPKIGIEGASIATMLGYMMAVIVAYLITIKVKLLEKESRILVSIIVFFIYLFLWRIFTVQNVVKSIILTIPFLILYLIIYKKEIIIIIGKIKKIIEGVK